MLTFDEPNADDNFNHLSEIVPSSQLHRIDGVKGWDAAHKAAAEASNTERFILVDGDAKVYPKFWSQVLRLSPAYEKGVLSFCARNVVNELCYGYGGLKIWTREFVRKMQTHENSTDPLTAFEFCWLPDYYHFATCWNETLINASPKQAFRAGFREVFKLISPMGVLTRFEQLSYGSQRKLAQWLMLGLDAENGEYCVQGAQIAYRLALHEGVPLIDKVNDYAALDEMFEEYGRFGTYWDSSTIQFDPLEPDASRAVKSFIRTPRKEFLNPLAQCAWDTE